MKPRARRSTLRISLALLLCAALLLMPHVFVVSEAALGQRPTRGAPPPRPVSTQAPAQDCLSDGEVSATIATLPSGKYADQQKAVTLLKDNANRSSACRTQVITSLMSAMDQPNLDLTGGTPQFFLWHYGTKLLGELKAVEAMDLLIANFELHDGSGFPLNHYPALGGAIHMGEVALPKLQSALKEHPDRYIRRHVVFCIALIGGKSAHQILREALPGESDPCVASCIRATLVEFDTNKRRPHQISDVGRTTWYSTFLCNGE